MASGPNIERLRFIQNVIDRLAENSFSYKKWSITVVAALLGFAIETGEARIALLGLGAAVAFACLDAYYLALERSFRSLYNVAVGESGDEWSLTPPTIGAIDIARALARPAVWLLHGATMAISLSVYFMI